ncbi:ketoacyl-synt-domain-containing protein [Westerdykella ornata]|uniref:Ketoacyl-synt-domain-containing protein n=1 Tax=Westerdykella ornata TaxID=318751 RepID=A0A6A6JYL6_WESOR|nr:ketoacyl-synt-domain-containing protein [Westerdykella ornata]KAF2280129.1 ketoacyl-synt-domain-containing protein [Westerdykella ornata]
MSRDIILFAGQGSDLSFDKVDILSVSAIATSFLEACHNALQSDLKSLTAAEKRAAGDLLDCFPSPNSLLDTRLQKNPVVQGLSLYTHQILEYIAYWSEHTEEPPTISETVGFCSGILPAVAISVCPSPESPDFIEVAVDGFRFAFWIGLRDALFCRKVVGDKWRSFPWSLTIHGLSRPELEKLLLEYSQTTSAELAPRIAAILSEKVISVSGEGEALREFKAECLPEGTRSRFANIHGFYHGGEALHEVLEDVKRDVDGQGIRISSWKSLKLPVRSALNGEYFKPNTSSATLLEAVLKHILVDQVDWSTTSDAILSTLVHQLHQDQSLQYKIIPVGPNTKPLLRAIKSGREHPRLRIASPTSKPIDGPSADDIAIVGMSVNYPSGQGPEQLWDTLERGLNSVQEIPSSRFQISDYYDPSESKHPRKMKARHGNFLENPFEFDNNFFQISPREAKSMDPQQRLLLHAALEALQDAGYAPDSTPSFQRESTGVYIGVATLDYVDNMRNDIDVYYSPGTLRAFLSGRISYAFQLKGPSVVSDTACSSSTVALYQACRALQSGDCSSALVGGVNVISSPDMYLGLSRAHFLSPTGQCKPWDASADGYCRAEGCAMFVLKKLRDAVAEGDRIYGVIRGIQVNQCGTAKSITHPDSSTQAKLFKSLISRANINPDSISVVEAHGTGTQAGDYAEVNSLQSVFGKRDSHKPLVVSSIKGNIGHAEAASGAAGLAKILLMMQKKQIPPQAAYKTLNPRLSTIAEHNIIVPTQTMKWRTPAGAPRRAMLNNFGAAGSNAAVLIEEYIQPPKQKLPAPSHHVFNLSAKTVNALERLRDSYCAYIEENSEKSSLSSICYTANARRQEFDAFRLSVTGQSPADLIQKLRQSKPPARGQTRDKLTVFVFSGQGSVYQGMGAELLATAPIFRDNVHRCNAILADLGFSGVNAFIGDDKNAFEALAPKERAILCQCACFVVEYSLAQLWLAWGVKPDILIGHSLGEYAALATSGVLKLHDALLLVARRALLMAELCQEGRTGMAAVCMPSAKVEELLSSSTSMTGLQIACYNSVEDCVVAGPLSSLDALVHACKSSGHKAKRLDVPFGFHSPALDPILEPYAELASTIKTSAGTIPIASSYLGTLLSPHDVDAEYFVGHARQPVEFVRATQTISRIAGDRAMTFLEIGPSPITLPMLKATLRQSEPTLLPSLKPSEQPWATMSSTLSSLFLQRYSIHWRQIYAALDAQFVPDFPHYPLSPSTFVVPFRESTLGAKAAELEPAESPFSFIGSRTSSKEGTMFTSKISKLADYIKAHNVGGAPLCPASVYIELAFEALSLVHPDNDQYYQVTELTFDKPLVYSEGNDVEVNTFLKADGSSFHVLSEGSKVHCTGSVTTKPDNAVVKNFGLKASYVKRQRDSVSFVDTFSSRMIYQVVFPRVVNYSEPYTTISSLSVAASGLEAVGRFRLPITGSDGFVCAPTFTDTLLHAAGFVANSRIKADEACICARLENVIVPSPEAIRSLYNSEMGLYCGLVEYSQDFIIGDAYALDGAGNVVACVEGMHFKKLRLSSFQDQLSRILKPKASPQGGRRPLAEQATAPKAQPRPALPVEENGHHDESGPRKAESTEDVRGTLHTIISELCGVPGPIDAQKRLSEMGVDSLLFIELTAALQKAFPQFGLGDSAFSKCETVQDVEKVLQQAKGPDSNPEAPAGRNGRACAGREVSNAESIRAKDEHRIDEFFKEVCGFSINGMDDSTTLDSLGVDSLLSIELAASLREGFGVELDENSVSKLSIGQIKKAMAYSAASTPPSEPLDQPIEISVSEPDSSYASDAEDLPPAAIPGRDTFPAPLYRAADKPDRPPLFLFHDGSGLCNVYGRLQNIDRDVYGIFSLDFSSVDTSIGTMEELASRYIDRAGFMKMGPIVLGGWSFGGVLAFEVSRQLRKRGKHDVLGVILIDSPHPVRHEPLPEAVISHVCSQMPAHSPALRSLRSAIAAQFRRNASLLAKYAPQPEKSWQCVMLKCKDTFDTKELCGVDYPWLSDVEFRQASVGEWERLSGGKIPVVEVKGNHFDLFEKGNIEDVSRQLVRASQRLQGTLNHKTEGVDFDAQAMSRTVKKWTPEEDEILLQQVTLLSTQNKVKDWTAIASAIPGRSNKDCRKRWCNHLVGGLRKGPWDPSEDRRLSIGVKEYGPQWPLVAEEVGTRSADQCAKRWQHSLDPSLDHSKWTEEEDKELLDAVKKHGRAWKHIQTQYFPGRATNNVKNRYTTLTRKRDSQTPGVGDHNNREGSESNGDNDDEASSAGVMSSSPSVTQLPKLIPDEPTIVPKDTLLYATHQTSDPFSVDLFASQVSATMDIDLPTTDTFTADIPFALNTSISNTRIALGEPSTSTSVDHTPSLFTPTTTTPHTHSSTLFDSRTDTHGPGMKLNLDFLKNTPTEFVLTLESPQPDTIKEIMGVLVCSKTKFKMEKRN